MKKLLAKWRNLPESAKASVAFVFSSLLSTGLNFITTPIFTRCIEADSFGIIGIYNSWLSIIDVFALAGLTSAGVFNVGLNENKEKRSRYISSVLGLCNILTVFVFAVLFAAAYIVGDSFPLPMNLLVLMLIHFLISPAYIFWITREKYEYRYKLSTVLTVISSVLSLAVSLGTVKLFEVMERTEALGEVRLWSAELALLLVYIPIYITVAVKGRSPVDISIWKKTLRFALPLIPHYLAQHIMASADTIMISELVPAVGEAHSAIYTAVAMVGRAATILWSAVNVSLISIIFEAIDRREYKKIQGLTAILTIGYGAICLVIVLLAPELVKVVTPSDASMGYETDKSFYVVPPLAAVSFLSCLYNLFANVEFYYKKSGTIAMATIISCVVNIALNLVLIPRFSYIGAAYTTLASYIVLIIIHYIGYRRATRDRVYSDKLLFLLSGITVALALLANLLYLNSIVRYVIIGVIALTALVMHRFIISKLKLLFFRKSVEEEVSAE